MHTYLLHDWPKAKVVEKWALKLSAAEKATV
jgi:hypothetical protein